LVKTILSKKVVIQKSSAINGIGIFAKEQINKGEILFIKGGHILTRQEMYSIEAIDSYWPISDNYVLAARNEKEAKRIKLFFNHSCDPNCGIRGDIVGIAIRSIDQGEEITFDYSMLDNEYYWFRCNCAKDNCRQIITSLDWKICELQERYKDYFAAYLKEKICKNDKYKAFTYTQDIEITKLCSEVFIGEFNNSFKKDNTDSKDKLLHCCLFSENKVVAYACLSFNMKVVKIDRIVVKKELRKSGLGKQIMFWAEIEARKLDCVLIELFAKAEDKGFFEKMGYKINSSIFEEREMNHLKMIKDIRIM
jgi:hypothetical protein